MRALPDRDRPLDRSRTECPGLRGRQRWTAGPAGRVFFAAITCLLLCSRVSAAGDRFLTADFDGDGRHDCATLDPREPSLLRVWLSATNSTLLIRSNAPLVDIAATDLDGDRRAELIARDNSAALRVWTHKRAGFHTFRPQRSQQPGLAVTHHRRVDDGPAGETSEFSSVSTSLLALLLSPTPRAPATVERSNLRLAPHLSVSVLLESPFAPRPPPLLATC